MNNGRKLNGQFAAGNPGGPGRPRRSIEREYLAALADMVTPDDWRDVVARALTDAKAGDAKARQWLARYLIGEQPPRLADVAASEARGLTAEEEIAALARQHEDDERASRAARGRGGPHSIAQWYVSTLGILFGAPGAKGPKRSQNRYRRRRVSANVAPEVTNENQMASVHGSGIGGGSGTGGIKVRLVSGPLITGFWCRRVVGESTGERVAKLRIRNQRREIGNRALELKGNKCRSSATGQRGDVA